MYNRLVNFQGYDVFMRFNARKSLPYEQTVVAEG